jgi:hypothetical protein
VSLVTIQKLMSHSTVRVTERYSHPGAAERRRAVELLAGRLDRSASNVVPFGGGSTPDLHSDGHQLDTTTVEGRASESPISLNCK